MQTAGILVNALRGLLMHLTVVETVDRINDELRKIEYANVYTLRTIRSMAWAKFRSGEQIKHDDNTPEEVSFLCPNQFLKSVAKSAGQQYIISTFKSAPHPPLDQKLTPLLSDGFLLQKS